MMRLGLTGWPISHSLSPKIHNAALACVGIEGAYDLYPADPAKPQELINLLDRVRCSEIQGLNITIPHKQKVCELVDRLSSSARSIGAVNTVYMDGNQLVGDNTDAPGFTADLANVSELDLAAGGNAIILGSGGSSRAVISELLKMSWNVVIAARNLEQSSSLITFYSSMGKISAIKLDYESVLPYLEGVNFIINTTPVGMYPNSGFSPWPAGLLFPANAFVYDLIYNPRQTEFVKVAKEAGLHAANGLGMLIEQAALAFEKWTGQPAPRKEMRSVVVNF